METVTHQRRALWRSFARNLRLDLSTSVRFCIHALRTVDLVAAAAVRDGPFWLVKKASGVVVESRNNVCCASFFAHCTE